MTAKLVKKNRLFNTLPKKLMAAIAVWLLGAVFFIGITLNITWKLEDRGVAINEAGSLRKQTYLITSLLQTHQRDQLQYELNIFDQKLGHLAELKTTRGHFSFETPPPNQELNVVKNKFVEFKAQIQQYQNAVKPNDSKLLQNAAAFIVDIDKLVKSIEDENTHNIQMMRLAQMLLMMMAVISAVLSMTLLNRLVLQPLALLSQGLEQIKRGRLSSRLDIQTNDEFQMVSDGFNQMAFSLKDLYLNLEEKVAQKTQDLAQTSQELAILYDMTALFHKTQLSEDALNTFLKKVIQLSMAQAGSIRLFNQQSSLMDTIVSINLPSELLKNQGCIHAFHCLCGQMKNTPVSIVRLTDEVASGDTQLACSQLGLEQLAIYKVQSTQEQFGILTLYYSQNHQTHFDVSEHPLIKLLCDQLAVAVENDRLLAKEKQYAVLEERNIMAQGLHDSIAQSLSFLNLQLQMLKQALIQKDIHKTEQHLAFLGTGIQECYDDVRELLHNFRLKLTHGSLRETLASAIQRFEAQTTIPVQFSFFATGSDLTPQQQLQLIFIVQEALSNIRKHAKASAVSIHFSNEKDIKLSIIDNGIGFDSTANKEDKGHHIGLSIMQERIARVNGQICIQSQPQQGTKIEVVIEQQHR